jgi:hypothetical protein
MGKSKLKKKKVLKAKRVSASTKSKVLKIFQSASFIVFAGSIIYIIGLFLPYYYDDYYGAVSCIKFFHLGRLSLTIMALAAVICFYGFINRKNYGLLLVVLIVICMGEPIGVMIHIGGNILSKSPGAGFFILPAGGVIAQAGAVMLIVLKTFDQSLTINRSR